MGATMSDLDTLVPQPVELTIAGEALAIRPLKVGQMPAFLRAINPVMHELTGSSIDWLAMLGEHGDELLSAIAIAVGKPRDWVDELPADEAILLAAKVIEVNADFFTRTVMPKLGGLFEQMATPMQATTAPGAGSTPSST